MLEKIDLTKKLDKIDYKCEMSKLEPKLLALQQTIKEYKIPVIITFEGWSSSGKGTLISKLLSPLDPRGFNVYTMDKVTEEMTMRPFLWSYWTKIPTKGRMTIFDKSWHKIILDETSKWNLNSTEKKEFYNDVNAFEKQLTDDGTLVIKIFLHISSDEQKRRFKELEAKKETKWRVDCYDWNQNSNYSSTLTKFEKMIHLTHTAHSPWHIIEANDRRFATAKLYKIIIKSIEHEIKRREEFAKKQQITSLHHEDIPKISILNTIDLSKTITKDDYKNKLSEYQNKLSDIVFDLYSKRRSVVIVYEGWDAAGKGGNIKRLTHKLDPRAYEVVPISAPTFEELNHHYLWRFWNKMPKDGHIAIFDRSWYGRVMVERIENYCSLEEWSRAYKEINDMERHIANHGTIIFKFWIQIDKDEQLKRFRLRQQDPLKQYKITDEDWRNREKWDKYQQAIDEMLFRTNTNYAPWTIVESNSKQYARIKVLQKVTTELNNKLK